MTDATIITHVVRLNKALTETARAVNSLGDAVRTLFSCIATIDAILDHHGLMTPEAMADVKEILRVRGEKLRAAAPLAAEATTFEPVEAPAPPPYCGPRKDDTP